MIFDNIEKIDKGGIKKHDLSDAQSTFVVHRYGLAAEEIQKITTAL